MRKFVSLLLVMLLILGAVSVVAAQDPTPTELSMWVFVNEHGEFMQRQADRWNEQNPDRPITVNWTYTEYNQMHNNLLSAFLVGEGAPDLVDIEIGKFNLFTQGDIHLIDLTDVVDPYREDIIQTRLAPYQYNGAQYGLDYHLGAFLMYYNRTVMEAAGVDPDSIVTWDDYVAAGHQVTRDVDGDGTNDVWMTAIETTGPMMARGVMLMNGGGTYNADGELILNSPENVSSLQFLQDMINVEGIATTAPGGNTGSPEFYTAFSQGQIASVWMPEWYMIRFPDNMVDLDGQMIVRPMPLFEEGGFTTAMGGGTGTAITDEIDPAKLDLAKEFLAFAKLSYDANIELWTVLGFDPIRPDVYDDPALLTTSEFFSGEVPFEILRSELGNVAPEYTGPQYADIQTIMTTTLLYDVLENGVAPADALAAASDQLASMSGG